MSYSQDQALGKVILYKSVLRLMDRTSPGTSWQAIRTGLMAPEVVRLFSHVCPTAPAVPTAPAAPAVPVTLAGPRQDRTIGPITIQTEVWYMDGPNTRASGTILTRITEARWPTEDGYR